MFPGTGTRVRPVGWPINLTDQLHASHRFESVSMPNRTHRLPIALAGLPVAILVVVAAALAAGAGALGLALLSTARPAARRLRASARRTQPLRAGVVYSS